MSEPEPTYDICDQLDQEMAQLHRQAAVNAARETAQQIAAYYNELIAQAVPIPVASGLTVQYQAVRIYPYIIGTTDGEAGTTSEDEDESSI